MDTASAPILTLLQAYLATTKLPPDGRLPPERVLADALGTSRGELRKALAALEADGQLWRHVGRGTFLTPRPLAAIDDIAALAAAAKARDVVQARLALEPELAACAARQASAQDLKAMRDAMAASRRPGQTWRGYELEDARLHREIAAAAGNPVLLHLFDQLAAVRRVMTWHRVRPVAVEGPPPDHPSFAEHDGIVAAIADRNDALARATMTAHIATVHAGMTLPEPDRPGGTGA